MIFHREYIKGLMQKHIIHTASDTDLAIMLIALTQYSENEISVMVQDLEFDFTVMRTLKNKIPQSNSSGISNDFYLVLKRIINSDGINTDHNRVQGINEWVGNSKFSCN